MRMWEWKRVINWLCKCRNISTSGKCIWVDSKKCLKQDASVISGFSHLYTQFITHFLELVHPKGTKWSCILAEEMSPFSLFVLNCLSSSTLLNIIATALTFPVKAQIVQCLAWHFILSISSGHFPSTWEGGIGWDACADGEKESLSSSAHMHILHANQALSLVFFNCMLFSNVF